MNIFALEFSILEDQEVLFAKLVVLRVYIVYQGKNKQLPEERW